MTVLKLQSGASAVVSGKRTQIVHTSLSGHMLRVEAARQGAVGVQILTMAQLAARLAGGFLQPVAPDALLEALGGALDPRHYRYPDIGAIQDLPGMARAAAATFDKVWRAGIDLSASSHPRLVALHALEAEALRRLPPSMKRPQDLVALALDRLPLAPRLFGPVEIHGHSEMSPCWRPLLTGLAGVTPVVWAAGARPVPAWLDRNAVEVREEPPSGATPRLVSCATPYHEALEAVRWMRKLLASGRARPEEIAIAAASPGDFDDAVMTLAADANIPVHFVHGVRATTRREGQTAAALADLLAKGLSQEGVRRLFALAGDSPALDGLPGAWTRLLPQDAPLTTLDRWRQVLARFAASDWPDGEDRSAVVLNTLGLIELGVEHAARIGEQLLPKRALALWRKALIEGPPEALPTTIAGLRVADNLEPASNVIWTSALALASAPRPFVRLVGMNSGRWPRRISEDRLIPDHVVRIDELNPLPIAEGDRRDYRTILASAREVVASASRRDEGGRLLGRSPLVAVLPETYLSRGRTPEHAASETDRLFARPAEFETASVAISAEGCWRDWFTNAVTPHDGLVRPNHPRLAKVFTRPMSATSLKLMLRDPIRFVWRYALGWKAPDPADEPLALDPVAFGALMHAALQRAVIRLEREGGLARSSKAQIGTAVAEATAEAAREWELESPTPPSVLWRASQRRVCDMASRALMHPLGALPGQRSWTEVGFGADAGDGRNDLPWDPTRKVEIPGVGGVFIHGYIDRLDLSADARQARVIDYKSGRIPDKFEGATVDGGNEVQRCLYAFAVKTLLGEDAQIEAALLYPGAGDGDAELFPLADVDGALDALAKAIAASRTAFEAGNALPGVDAGSKWNDFAFVLPSAAGYLARKSPLFEAALGEAAEIWTIK